MGSNGRSEHKRGIPRAPPLALFIAREQQDQVAKIPQPPAMRPYLSAAGSTKKRLLSKQLSMKETTREVKWEKRRRQMQRQRSSMGLQDARQERYASMDVAADGEAASSSAAADRTPKGLTDEDLDELKGSMELGFGFDEENGGQDLCDTLPALDLYFAVNRQLSEPKMRKSTSSLPSVQSTPASASSSSSTLCGSPGSASPSWNSSSPVDSWKICSPGENPQLVKTRLRHWAQVVACSVKHSSGDRVL